jgi:hypothetical protein
MACYTDWLIAETKRIASVVFHGAPNDNSGGEALKKEGKQWWT